MLPGDMDDAGDASLDDDADDEAAQSARRWKDSMEEHARRIMSQRRISLHERVYGKEQEYDRIIRDDTLGRGGTDDVTVVARAGAAS